MRKPSIPTLLSFNAGYLDTAGYLALHGLFTAHVTGNFVTLGASLVHGTTGAIAKLLALPIFCLVVVLARLLHYLLVARNKPVLRTLLMLKLTLLAFGAALAFRYGPFPNGDSVSAIVTGLTFVAAMAIQNAVQRVHLANAPPTTLMTGSTTQLMLDIADKMHGVPSDQDIVINARIARLSSAVAVFALGCSLGALLFTLFSTKCFIVAPLIAVLVYLHKDASNET
jgi:uncharacterized membrane protein YoaK (UPF0700 family)